MCVMACRICQEANVHRVMQATCSRCPCIVHSTSRLIGSCEWCSSYPDPVWGAQATCRRCCCGRRSWRRRRCASAWPAWPPRCSPRAGRPSRTRPASTAWRTSSVRAPPGPAPVQARTRPASAARAGPARSEAFRSLPAPRTAACRCTAGHAATYQRFVPACRPACAACAASLATLATYLKAAAPEAVAAALAGGVFQALLDLRRPLHLSPATAAYLQAFVAAQRNPVKARAPAARPAARRRAAAGRRCSRRRAWQCPGCGSCQLPPGMQQATV